MKKIALSMIAALAIFSVSCSKSDSKDDTCDSTKTEATKGNDVKAQVKEIFTKAISDVKANPANAAAIAETAGKQMQEIIGALPEDKQKEIYNDPELMKLSQEFGTAIQSADRKSVV